MHEVQIFRDERGQLVEMRFLRAQVEAFPPVLEQLSQKRALGAVLPSDPQVPRQPGAPQTQIEIVEHRLIDVKRIRDRRHGKQSWPPQRIRKTGLRQTARTALNGASELHEDLR